MRRSHLGEFEELIMLTVGILYDDAYSVTVLDEIKKQTGRTINVSAVHSALYRLEDKGFLSSRMADASATRGGKRKRKFTMTAEGKKVLDANLSLRKNMYSQIPEIAFS